MASSKAGSKKKGKKAQAETPPGGGGFRSLLRGCATLLLVLLILYVTMVLFTRTDGFRSYLEGQLEKKFGLLADVGSSRMGWSGVRPVALRITPCRSRLWSVVAPVAPARVS